MCIYKYLKSMKSVVISMKSLKSMDFQILYRILGSVGPLGGARCIFVCVYFDALSLLTDRSYLFLYTSLINLQTTFFGVGDPQQLEIS